MELLLEYVLFLAKAATIVIAIIAILLLLINLKASSAALKEGGRIEFDDMSERLELIRENFEELADSDASAEKTDKKFWQFWKKSANKEKKVEKSAKDQDAKQAKNNLYVIDFDGDVAAEAVKNLRQEVTAILQIAKKEDEVLVRLKSPGGVVHGYGLAASQLVRFRDKGIHLTVAVDEVAASGGYLMACVADRIIAAPFSIIGSVGVVAQLPNFHRLLDKYDIDFEQFTAGKYKRTVTMFGENTDEGREKFTEELEEIHVVFKEFIARFRPDLDVENIATGEHWLAVKAKELGLVDELQTSDSYYQDKLDSMKIYSVVYKEKKSVRQGIFRFFAKLSNRLSL